MNLSVRKAAQILNVTEKTIYRWIKQELVPAYRVNGQYRFNQSELIEWATSRRMGVSAEAFQDTGPGIAEELQDKIFEPFFTTKTTGEGTGLGLSVSFAIVKEHQGTIKVSSGPDKGATFTLRFPVFVDTVQGGGIHEH